MTDFVFDLPAWEQSIRSARGGSCISAVHFLAMMEQESEEDFEDALALLEQKDILLDVTDLPVAFLTGEIAVRLRQEEQLVQNGCLQEGLEENDPLRLFLEEAALGTHGDVGQLAAKSAAGDSAAREQLTNACLSRVITLAQEYVGHGVLLLDLIQEGSLGLWQAICDYTGGDFSIQRDRRIRIYLAKTVTVQARESGIGQKMRQALEDYQAADRRLLTKLGRNPTMEEIAVELRMTLEAAETVAQMLEAARSNSRTMAAAQPREETQDDAAAVENTAYFQMRQRITDLLSTLEPTQARVLSLRFGLEGGLPMTPEDTGKQLGLTPQEVLTIEADALAQLRDQA